MMIAPLRFLTLFLFLFLFMGLSSSASWGKDIFISDITVSHDDKNLLFYSTLDGVFDRELIDNIYKGVEITINYDLELIKKQKVWFNSTDVFMNVKRSVKYSPLKKEFLLYEDDLSTWKVTNRLADAKRWLTELEFVPVYDYLSLGKNQEYFFSVKARLEGEEPMFPYKYLSLFGSHDDESDRAFSDPFLIKPLDDESSSDMLQEEKR